MVITKLVTNQNNSYFDSIIHKMFIDLKLDWKYRDQKPLKPAQPFAFGA